MEKKERKKGMKTGEKPMMEMGFPVEVWVSVAELLSIACTLVAVALEAKGEAGGEAPNGYQWQEAWHGSASQRPSIPNRRRRPEEEEVRKRCCLGSLRVSQACHLFDGESSKEVSLKMVIFRLNRHRGPTSLREHQRI